MSSTQDLFRAAEAGQKAKLKAILAHGQIRVDSKDVSGHGQSRTALLWAVLSGKRDAVEVLLQSGASVKSRDHAGSKPLILAAQKEGATGTVAILLSVLDIEVDASNLAGVTALMEASKRGYLDTARLLLKSKKVVWLILQYGAFRGFKNKYGQIAQHFGQPQIAHKEVFGEFPSCADGPTLSETVERDSAPSQDTLKHNTLYRPTRLQWSHMLHPRTQDIKAVGFSFLPKDRLSRGQIEEEVTLALQLATNMTEIDAYRKRCMWIHIPSNNILWVRWAIQHLPLSYRLSGTAERTNLIGVIDDALEEVRQSPNRRKIHCESKGEVLSVVVPYFAIESGSFLQSRQNGHSGKHLPSFEAMSAESQTEALRFHYLSELAKEYGPESIVREQKDTLHLPQTLDQSHFTADQPLLEQDMDQVFYRYIVNGDKAEAKLLMVNQLWLWQIKNLVVTAFPEPWTGAIENTLRGSLDREFLDLGRANEEIVPEDFVGYIIRQCIIISDQPGYGGVGKNETWATIFSKSISDHGILETRRCKEVLDCVRNISSNNSSPGKSNALYDIYPETDGLRQVRDVRDELKTIRAVWENQKIVEDKLNQTYLHAWRGHGSGWFASRDFAFKSLDEEAQGVEKRFNQLIDLKQQQASLSLAREADRRDRNAERRHRENEKQSQLLFVFTVITVIFTPLNFVAAFMATLTKQFPHQGDNISWSWWQAFVGMLVAEILSVPTIWFAVQSTHLQELFRAIWDPHGKAEARPPAEQDEGIRRSKPGSSPV